MLRIRRMGRYLLYALLSLVLLANIGLFLAAGTIWAATIQCLGLLVVAVAGWLSYRDGASEREHRRVLLKVNQDLSSRLELGDLLDYIVQSILQLIPLADKCVIHLLDERGRRLYPRYSSRPDWERILGMPADKGIAGQALKELRTIVVADVRQDAGFLPLHSGSELTALMVAPLHAQGKPLGTISLNSSVRGAFSKQDELLVSTLAAQASAAINLSQLYAAALNETQHIEALIANLADGLVVLDAEGRVVRYNPSLAHLLGVDALRITGQKVSIDAPEEELRRLALILGDCLQEVSRTCEQQVVLETPIHAVLRVHTAPVRDHDGNWGRIVIVHDETAESERIKGQTDLLAAASEELLMSLEGIRGYITLLLSRDSADRALLGQVREQTLRLTRLVEDLADISAVDGNTLEARVEPVAVDDLLADTTAELAPLAERRQVSVEVQCPPNLTSLPLDGERLRRVWLNLLESALHRSHAGGRISLKVEATLEEITCTLTGNGEAISPAVWARMARGRFGAGVAATPRQAGDDLGIYLSRRIIEAGGGQMWLPDGSEGFRLQFALPLTPAPQERAEAGKADGTCPTVP